MKKFLFPQPTDSKGFSLLLLCLRIFFGLMLMMHGLDKLYNYDSINFSFPDPMGMGSQITLLFTIFAELVCSIAFIFGVLFRITMLPILFVLAVAFLHIHGASIIQGELAFIYLVILVMMYISGPGQYSVDAKIYEYIHNKDDDEYEY